MFASAQRRESVKAAAAAARTAAPGPARSAPPKWKTVVVALCFTAMVVSGSVYGAGLKTRKDLNERKKKATEATVEQKVAMLEQQRARLLTQKNMLEEKMAGIQERIDAKGEGAASR